MLEKSARVARVQRNIIFLRRDGNVARIAQSLGLDLHFITGGLMGRSQMHFQLKPTMVCS